MKTVYILLVSAYLRISRRKVQKTQNLRGIIQDLNFFFLGGGGIENVFNSLFQKNLADLNRDIYYEIIQRTIP